ncbi:Opsin-5 [Orchesella cincta]|uniref:Opsin-5 n=1 Tax=Orchesella cincta TaxID=48709 RepID=A0A1D2MY81_ORCCI|nr:Opsin-5 [Orchesella cincta]
MIAWGYIFALVWALPPLIGFGNYELEPFGLSCTLDWVARDQASKIYMVLVTIFCVFLPLLIILFCYCQIILLVKQSDALVRSNGVNKRNMKGSDLQLTWISGLVSLGFIIGWGPYTVVSLWASYRGEVILPIWATPIPVLLAKSSIAYNPFIYIFFTARYREDFISLCRLYGKVSTGKTNGDRFPNSGPNGGGGNNNGDESPGNSGSSSLVTRQYTNTTATNSQNNNNNTPNHDNYPRRSEEEELIPVYDELASPSLSNGYHRGGTITANMLNAMDQQNEGLCHHQELSIVVVRDPSTSAHAITMINGVPATKKLVLPFKKVLKEEQV